MLRLPEDGGELFRLGWSVLDAVTDLDRHHDWGRYGWEIRQGAKVLLEGVDLVQFAEDGRLRNITGFFDAP